MLNLNFSLLPRESYFLKFLFMLIHIIEKNIAIMEMEWLGEAYRLL